MASLDLNASPGRRRLLTPRIDMTPMVDLAFLLLTFFVMTTTLNKAYKLDLQQPVPDATGKRRTFPLTGY